jgi:DNA recombination protein RmuC
MMSLGLVGVIALACLALGLLLGWLWPARELATSQALLSDQKADLNVAQGDLSALRMRFEAAIRDLSVQSDRAGKADQLEKLLAETRVAKAQADVELSKFQTQLAERERSVVEQLAQLTTLREETEQKFKGLAEQALRTNEQAFLRLANETLEKHRVGSSEEIAKNKVELAQLLLPVQDTLKRYEANLGDMEKIRAGAYEGMKELIAQMRTEQNLVHTEAGRLANMLRSNVKARGTWGEHQLRNVLEQAGLSAYSDFKIEDQQDGLRPDVKVRLPGGRILVIDAKTPLTSFQHAHEAETEEERKSHLVSHARAMKERARELSDKKYWDQFTDAPDFVIMFVPGEHFVHAAMENDPDLWDYALQRRVLIATPLNLVALAKTVAQIWRQEKLTDTARTVAQVGRDVYKRLTDMGSRIQDVGKKLNSTVAAYNSMVGTIESSVLPQARKFNELDVEGADQSLSELLPIETAVRLPVGGRDLLLPGADEVEHHKPH